MYKREITPLSESMLDAISSTINKLEYVEEVELDEAYKSTKPIEDYVEKGKWLNPRSIPKELTAKIGPVGSTEKIRQVMLIRGSRTSPVNAIALLTSMTPAEVAKLLDVDRSVVYKIRKKSIIYVDMKLDTILESVELEEAPNTLQKITAILTKMGNGTKVVKDKAGYFHIKMTDGKNMSHKGPYHTLEDVLSALQKDMKEEVELDEAKMSDTEVLNAAKSLAKNGKDAKTKAFGKGLVDFYQKNKSFTPDQVGGLQNIMKNASFQMAEEVEVLDESKALLKDYQDMKERGKKDSSIIDVLMSMPKYKKMNRNQMAKIIGDAKRKGLFKEETIDLEEANLSKMEKMALKSALGFGGSAEPEHLKVIEKLKKMGLVGEIEKQTDVAGTSYYYSLTKKGKEQARAIKEELEEKYAKVTDKLDDGEGMDPVGKADADIDNDGDVDSSDEYLHKRRKAIGKAMKKRKD